MSAMLFTLKRYFQILYQRWHQHQVMVIGSILSLLIGTVCIVLLVSYLKHELTTDRFHHQADRIYLTMHQVTPTSQTRPLHLKRTYYFDPSDYPGVEAATTVLRYDRDRMVLKAENQTLTGVALVVDSNFLEVFDFPLLFGDPQTLADPGSILITKDFALKHFGSLDVLNKKLEWIGHRSKLYKIAGVLAPIPSNSSLQFELLVPYHSMRFQGMGGCFLLVNEQFEADAFTVKMTEMGQKIESFQTTTNSLAPLNKLYFNRENWNLQNVTDKHGNVNTLYTIAVIAALVLIISILNLTNLWALQALHDRKEILVRKVNGAKKMDLIRYQLGKITPLLLLSVIFSIILCGLALPAFNNLLETDLPVPGLEALIMIVLVISAMALLSQIYPIMLITRPVMKDSLALQFVNRKSPYSRKAIVSVQYTFTIILLISAMVVSRQLDLMLEKDLGFDYADIVRTKLIYEKPYEFLPVEERRAVWEKRKAEFQFVQSELGSSPYVADFTQGWNPLLEHTFPIPFKPKSSTDDYEAVNFLIVAPGYEQLFGFELLEGRFFEEADFNLYSNKIIVNEAARKHWDIQDISNSPIVAKGAPLEEKEIIGVVRNFYYQHLSQRLQPLVIRPQQSMDDEFFIKLRPEMQQEGLLFLKALFEKMNPSQLFEYSLLAEEVRARYRNEERLARVYITLTIIAFLLSGMGLFVIALHEVQKRTKEIGIRKANGAKASQIIRMLNLDFIKWVFLAFCLACPIAYYSMSRWLESFAHKIPLSWWIFAVAGLLALLIALLTVSWQSWRAARRDPVEALRYE